MKLYCPLIVFLSVFVYTHLLRTTLHMSFSNDHGMDFVMISFSFPGSSKGQTVSSISTKSWENNGSCGGIVYEIRCNNHIRCTYSL